MKIDRLNLRQTSQQLLLALSVLALGLANSLGNATRAAEESSKAAVAEADEKEASEVAEKADAKADKEKSADSKADSDSEDAEKKDAKEDAKAKEGKDSDEDGEEKSSNSSKSKPKASTAKKKSEASAKEKRAAAKRAKVRLAMLTLKDSLPESTGEVGPFSDVQLDLREVISRLEKAQEDKSIAGIVLDIQNPAIGRGKVEELRGAIARYRAAGKKAYAMLESAEPADYLVACACDEIVMPESGVIMLPGVHAEATFYKGLLDKLGIRADFIHIGDAKGAAEPLTNEKFSEPVKQNLTSLIDSMYDDMVTTIVKDRPISIAQAKEIIDTGILTAKRAKELGLIDRVAYPETLRQELAKSYEAEPLVYVKNYGQKEVDTDFSGTTGIFKLMQAMMGGDKSSRGAKGKKIAVVYAIGPIMSGQSESGMFGSVMGSTTIVEALRKANADDDVVAIVLRIDSPGGSALASDLIWNQTQVIEKPIVASMGDVAASGGYYIAMGTDKIIASPGTITGSIGVVGGKLAIRGLYDKLGITYETIERGKNSGLFASSGMFTESQRTVVKAMMEDIYDQFTTKAAEGRKMPLEKLRSLAGGRVYSGRQAQENGLVDQLGTLEDAIVEAKKLAGLDADAEVKVDVLPEPTSFFETLFGDLDSEREVTLGRSFEAVSPELMEVARRVYFLRSAFNQPAALVMPFDLNVR